MCHSSSDLLAKTLSEGPSHKDHFRSSMMQRCISGILILCGKTASLPVGLVLATELLESHKPATRAHRMGSLGISIGSSCAFITRDACCIIWVAGGAAGCVIVVTAIVVVAPITLAETTRQAEDDSCKQETCKGSPTKCISAYAKFGIDTCVFKNVAAFDGPSTGGG